MEQYEYRGTPAGAASGVSGASQVSGTQGLPRDDGDSSETQVQKHVTRAMEPEPELPLRHIMRGADLAPGRLQHHQRGIRHLCNKGGDDRREYDRRRYARVEVS